MEANLYLSRLGVEATRLQPAAVLADPYRLHQAIMAAFDPTERGERRVLYRRETAAPPGHAAGPGAVFLVQSETPPHWTPVAERFFGDGLTAETKSVCYHLTEGQWLGFRLRANPTFRRLRGPRLAVQGEAAQRGWLHRKLEGAGARLEEVEVQDEGWVQGGVKSLAFRSIRFDGWLEVQDAERLLAAVRAGIGSAKAFGFGLLSLRPVDLE